jgi:hypothetical protein
VIVNSAWAERNIGFDPAKGSAPVSAFADNRVASSGDPDDFVREIIDFDPEGSEGAAFVAFTKSTGLIWFMDISWPTALISGSDTFRLASQHCALGPSCCATMPKTTFRRQTSTRPLAGGVPRSAPSCAGRWSRHYNALGRKRAF